MTPIIQTMKQLILRQLVTTGHRPLKRAPSEPRWWSGEAPNPAGNKNSSLSDKPVQNANGTTDQQTTTYTMRKIQLIWIVLDVCYYIPPCPGSRAVRHRAHGFTPLTRQRRGGTVATQWVWQLVSERP